MNIITKAVASIAPVTDDDSPNGSFDVILSAETLDRDGERLLQDEWELPLPDHITFDQDHGLSVASAIGSGKPFFNDDGQIQVRGTYSSIARAQEVRTLVNEGHLKTVSVAFATHKNTKAHNGVSRELLNGSFVLIPSNREAVVLSAKSASVPQSGAEHNQAIHDHSTAMGAQCPANSEDDSGSDEGANKSFMLISHSSVVTKGISGSVEDLRSRLNDALSERYPDQEYGVWAQATFLDSLNSGTVVYEIDNDLFSRTFTDDGKSVKLGDEVLDVSLITSVVTEDEDDESDDNTKATDNVSTPAANAAAELETKSAAEVALRARAILITNEALTNYSEDDE